MSDESRSRFFDFGFVVIEAVFGAVDDDGAGTALFVVVCCEEEEVVEEGAIVVAEAEETVDEVVPAESKFGLESVASFPPESFLSSLRLR